MKIDESLIFTRFLYSELGQNLASAAGVGILIRNKSMTSKEYKTRNRLK